MNLCWDHDIAYNTKGCPVCEADEIIKDLEKQIEELEKDS